MRLLLTNDDGVQAQGLHELANALCKDHEVVVVAPDSQRSGFGHSFTVRRPLSVERATVEGLPVETYITDGTPADCTRIGLYFLEGKPFDAVVTGINHGSNIGTDVFYSGTVGAAMEAAMHLVPAMATSLARFHDAEEMLPMAAQVVKRVIDTGILAELPGGKVLNLNVPPAWDGKDIKGIRWVRHGYNDLHEVAGKTENSVFFKGQNRIGMPVDYPDDFRTIDEGWASLSVLDLDVNNTELLEKYEKEWKF